MKTTSKTWIRNSAKSRWLKGLMAFAVFFVAGPSYAIECAHNSSMKMAGMKACMQICQMPKMDHPDPMTGHQNDQVQISAVPCVKGQYHSGAVWTQASAKPNLEILQLVVQVYSGTMVTPPTQNTFSLTNHGPPRANMPVGYPAGPTSHGPPRA